ncbi:hypothetical protein EVAR_70168_1 [Eumeta japonica]|uniref:Uncharacterized protein n=1 Tax=Eumeta variegata TaxID=151549 RepID=A0A4C1SVN3_EUMVA|nr:hypothetical protein EVAR_70168_1 [Eumeta japonica]
MYFHESARRRVSVSDSRPRPAAAAAETRARAGCLFNISAYDIFRAARRCREPASISSHEPSRAHATVECPFARRPPRTRELNFNYCTRSNNAESCGRLRQRSRRASRVGPACVARYCSATWPSTVRSDAPRCRPHANHLRHKLL